MTTSGFDPELYLRRLGERELASGLDIPRERLNGRGQLSEAAAALSVAGVINAELAQTISADYESAFELRKASDQMLGRHPARLMARAASAPPPEALPARRVFLLGASVPLAGGTLNATSLTLTDESVRLEADIRWERGLAGAGGSGPPDITIRTPAGQSLTAGFSGGWGPDHANGHFEAAEPLDPTLEWIEIEGSRLSTLTPVTPPPVRVDALETGRICFRYLWHLLSDFGDRHNQGGGVQAATEALIAAGLIGVDDPELDAVRWVAGGPARPRHPPAGPQARAPGMPDAVPGAWRSLLSRGPTSGGPTGTIAVAAVTPLFGGISVAVNTLKSSPDSFGISVDTSGIPHPGPIHQGTLRRPVAWWATDDRGNHYLGQSGSWSSSGDRGSGEISFGPLEAGAERLTLAVSTLTARAIIPIRLEWGE